MQSQMKRCPRCQAVAELSAAFCADCGHQFRTQFDPNDRTQTFSPGQTAYSPNAPTNGPLDNTERAVSMGWTLVGLLFFYIATGVAGGLWWSAVAQHEQGDSSGTLETMTFFFFFLVSGSILSALTMRFRRLYLSSPGGVPHPDIHQRRGRFAVAGTLGILGLCVFAFYQMRADLARVQAANIPVVQRAPTAISEPIYPAPTLYPPPPVTPTPSPTPGLYSGIDSRRGQGPSPTAPDIPPPHDSFAPRVQPFRARPSLPPALPAPSGGMGGSGFGGAGNQGGGGMGMKGSPDDPNRRF